ncbi:MAG: F0F1 ATP synthase subunit gamma [Desulfobacterales bacterium]
MPSLERLKRQIESTHDLQSVVKTMKALAAVNIRQFEKAVKALKGYNETVEAGLQAVLRDRPGFSITARGTAGGRLGAVVFGSDQGMCGALNETIVAHALSALEEQNGGNPPQLVAVGVRALNRLEEEGRQVARLFSVPGSVGAVSGLVRKLLLTIEQWLEASAIQGVLLFHCTPKSKAAYAPRQVRLLPVDRQWLSQIRQRAWPGKQLPWFSMAWDPLFAALIRQYLFVSLYRAAAESLAAENASRLAAMQGAESNIAERLDELQAQYHRQRQMGITEELLDIVSGFEALQEDRE